MIQELPGKGVTSVSQHRISLKVAADIKSRVSFDSGIESFSCFEQVTQPMVHGSSRRIRHSDRLFSERGKTLISCMLIYTAIFLIASS